jgi:hypothetical protein
MEQQLLHHHHHIQGKVFRLFFTEKTATTITATMTAMATCCGTSSGYFFF